jgi:hypothetical protein
VQAIGAFGHGEEITEQAVASYVAKYATKAAETTGTVDRRIGNKEALVLLGVPDHPARLIEACLDLHALYPDRKLRGWAHMLGFRGHFSTKSRRYSTTLGALRQTRADYRDAQQREALGLPDPDAEEATTLTLAHWSYAGHGHTPANPGSPPTSAVTSSTTANSHARNYPPCSTSKELQHDQRRP